MTGRFGGVGCFKGGGFSVYYPLGFFSLLLFFYPGGIHDGEWIRFFYFFFFFVSFVFVDL